jgi:hypothetical protein
MEWLDMESIKSIKDEIEYQYKIIKDAQEEIKRLQMELTALFSEDELKTLKPKVVDGMRLKPKAQKRIIWDQKVLSALYKRDKNHYRDYIQVEYTVLDKVLKKTPPYIKKQLLIAKKYQVGKINILLDYEARPKL